MNNLKIAVITHSQAGKQLGVRLQQSGLAAELVASGTAYDELMDRFQALIFIGALGICVRGIAPFLKDKKTDPAVVNLDVQGRFVQPVIAGHLGGANKLARELSRLLGAVPVLTTVSDTTDLWSLDLLPRQFGWSLETKAPLTRLIAAFVNREPVALLLEARDEGSLHLECTAPGHVQIFYDVRRLNASDFGLIIAVTPYLHDLGEKLIYYRPRMLSLGMGCQHGLPTDGLAAKVAGLLSRHRLSALSVRELVSAELKQDEKALQQLAQGWDIPFRPYASEILAAYGVPNPSEKVEQVAGTAGVAEAAAMHASGNSLIVEKQKFEHGGKFATLAVAIDRKQERKGFVEIVGAGPGDPQLVTVRGKQLLQTADLILYAGSLVPRELTEYAKAGCVVRSSASLDLEEQVNLMREFYDRSLVVVRLHTGDPCIYGAIQEQMNLMDRYAMDYRITPGVSSFQAAAAALKSQFTIPEEVQTIILTRGEGRTPVPEREQLHRLAQSQSTMCIYLSASIAAKVESELLEHYPAETPVAVCYKLTWKEERIYRCSLGTLAQTVMDNKLSMTTLIVVGKAIDNRQGTSKLYDSGFKHAFRS